MITKLLDRLYDRLNQTETARAYNEDGKCIAVLRLPKGYGNAIEELIAVLECNAPDDIEFVTEEY